MNRFLSPKNIIFPFYHTISDKNCPHIKNLYPVKTISQFEKELDFFQKNYQSISLEEIKIHVENGTQPDDPSFFLSFDDGLAECYSLIAPMLKKRNISAAFFINTGFVGNKDLFYRYKVSLIIEKIQCSKYKIGNSEDLLNLTIHDSTKIDEIAKEIDLDFDEFLQQEKPYMCWVQIKELAAQGFYIGGHSVNHPYYNQISMDEQLFQTKSSIESIIKKLDLDYKIFSFPFTDLGVKKDFFESVYSDGIAEMTFGTAGIKKDEFDRNLQRIPMDNCLGNPQRFLQKNLIQYHLKKLINKDKVIHPL